MFPPSAQNNRQETLMSSIFHNEEIESPLKIEGCGNQYLKIKARESGHCCSPITNALIDDSWIIYISAAAGFAGLLILLLVLLLLYRHHKKVWLGLVLTLSNLNGSITWSVWFYIEYCSWKTGWLKMSVHNFMTVTRKKYLQTGLLTNSAIIFRITEV